MRSVASISRPIYAQGHAIVEVNVFQAEEKGSFLPAPSPSTIFRVSEKAALEASPSPLTRWWYPLTSCSSTWRASSPRESSDSWRVQEMQEDSLLGGKAHLFTPETGKLGLHLRKFRRPEGGLGERWFDPCPMAVRSARRRYSYGIPEVPI